MQWDRSGLQAVDFSTGFAHTEKRISEDADFAYKSFFLLKEELEIERGNTMMKKHFIQQTQNKILTHYGY